ncbi:PD40 domain-containing protein [Candidatus Uhrbacteria bacterium]|nr:PD40 domain-containing protein [Candidatus Uhrbacteria bacterium]
MWRKLLIGVGLVALVVLIGAGIYFAFFRRAPVEGPPAAPPVNLVPINAPPLLPPVNIAPPIPGALLPPAVNAPPTVAAPPPGVTTVAQGGRTFTAPLTDTPANFVRIASDGRLNFYDPTSGRFYRIGADGKPVSLSDRQFPNVKSVAWSPRDDRAILEFPDGANVSYDFRTDRQVTLPAHWEDFSFSPTGDHIAGKSIGFDRENRFLFEAEPDGNGFRTIEPLGTNARRVDVSWSPNNQVLAFARTGQVDLGDERQLVVAVGRHKENFPGITVEGQDFRPLWSPSGSRLLFSSVHSDHDYKPELWVVGGVGDAIGRQRQRLRIDTWADKCAFANDTTLYCAIPERLDRGAGLEPAVADTTPDRIERIDLTTGVRTTVGNPSEDASIAQLSVAPDGSALYFTSKQDGRLREMRLR